MPTTRAGTGTAAAQSIGSMDSEILDNTNIHPAINWADGLDVEIPENVNVDWSEYETYLARPGDTAWLNLDAGSSIQSTGFDGLPATGLLQ